MPNKHNLTIPFPPEEFQTALLRWYDRARRDLPWRAKPGFMPDPYRVWLSEIMLQQTGVKAVIPYFEAFLARWPTVEALGDAALGDVLAAWAGLGYYSRARNLHACAKILALSGFPESEAGLRALPGIGAYTAAAIAAIAFGAPAAAADGNVERVIARLFSLEAPLPGAKPQIRASAGSLVPKNRPGDYAQAMMDLGAIICTPRSPFCARMSCLGFCSAGAQGSPERYPVKSPKAARPIRRGDAFVIVRTSGDGRHILLRRRPEKGLLGGMMEVPCTEWVSRRKARASGFGILAAGAAGPAHLYAFSSGDARVRGRLRRSSARGPTLRRRMGAHRRTAAHGLANRHEKSGGLRVRGARHSTPNRDAK